MMTTIHYVFTTVNTKCLWVADVTSDSSDKIKAVVEANSAKPVPKWLDCNKEQMTVTVVELPKREDIDLDVAEHLIVELYSK